METFRFEKPSIEMKDEFIDLINEFVEHKSNINGTGEMDKILDGKTYEEVLESVHKLEDSEYAKSVNKCPGKEYFMIRNSDNRIVGMVNVRYDISQEMLDNGVTYIGDAIRPTERGKGYSKIMIYKGLLEEQKMGEKVIYIDCNATNIPSDKSIQAMGGEFIKQYVDQRDGELTNYYKFDVDKCIEINKDIYGRFIEEKDEQRSI